jgi:amidase
MMTTAGSLALAGSIPLQDSSVAKKLRDAGAVIIGKTNLSEWANFRSSHSSSGWSGRGGQTRNPYVLDRNPCGSSSGTGAAIAANLAGDWRRHGNRRLGCLSPRTRTRSSESNQPLA